MLSFNMLQCTASMINTLRMASLVLGLAITGFGQSGGLPVGLAATFENADNTDVSADMFALDGLATGDWAVCGIAYETLGQEVILGWHLSIDQVPGVKIDRVSVSFQPTAVAKRAGTTHEFFVAGYVPRTDTTLVERWEFDDVLTAVYASVGGAGARATLSYTIRKEVLVSSPAAQWHVKAMAYNRYGEELLLALYSPFSILMRLDHDTGILDAMATDAIYPQLPKLYSMVTVHTNHEFMIRLGPWPQWLVTNKGLQYQQGSGDYPYLLLRDADFDGIFEDVTQNLQVTDYWALGYTDGVEDGVNPFYP